MRETCKKLLVLEKENGAQVLANALQKFTKGDLKTVYEQHKDVYEQYKKNEELKKPFKHFKFKTLGHNEMLMNDLDTYRKLLYAIKDCYPKK